ncbi:MAG: sigma-70 family RNA polymerase sigma factor [Oscillospiraceae bacterium]|nr:sigma-70 family RNA polymerase sigma factor [Oscillospiraceae bacterium]
MDVKKLSIEEIVHRYSTMLYRLAFAKTGNNHDAEDIVQEVFIKLITHEKSGKTFNDEEHRKAWLIRVTSNISVNVARSPHKVKNAGEFNEEFADSPQEDKAIKDFETRSLVEPAVMSLPEKERVAVHLFYYEGLSLSQIAKATGQGINTVKSRLFRARKLLKEKLKGVDFDEDFV